MSEFGKKEEPNFFDTPSQETLPMFRSLDSEVLEDELTPDQVVAALDRSTPLPLSIPSTLSVQDLEFEGFRTGVLNDVQTVLTELAGEDELQTEEDLPVVKGFFIVDENN